MERELKDRLPTGVDNFELFHAQGLLYADKTELLYRMVKTTRPYFLSRPRRFGKTLLVSTLQCILEGRSDLFDGLWIHGSDYDWEPGPAIRLSLAGASTASAEALENALTKKVLINAFRHGEELPPDDPSACLETLINRLYFKHGGKPVAVFIDEYDAPVLESITNTRKAEYVQKTLTRFYGALKAASEARGFTFITGVTRFPEASVFSELNNLTDLTLNEDYAAICGISAEEFDSMFGEETLLTTLNRMQGLGFFPHGATTCDLRSTIFEMYDGYSWDGKTRVMNPWSILNFFFTATLQKFWFESGSPSFLAGLIAEKGVGEGLIREGESITASCNTIDAGDFNPAVLMFQTGYLTVGNVECLSWGRKFNLRFPNLEVKAAMVPHLLAMKNWRAAPFRAKAQADAVLACIFENDAAGLQESFRSYLNNFHFDGLTPDEAGYRGILKSVLLLAGQPYDDCELTDEGLSGVHLTSPGGNDYIIGMKCLPAAKMPKGKQKGFDDEEMADKMTELSQKALNQIENNKYAEKYKGRSIDILPLPRHGGFPTGLSALSL